LTEVTGRLSSALADRYRLERHLGEGGMATVYLAHDLKHDRKVAVKVLRPELAAILGGERFLNEIKVTANLQHPNILPLYDSGEADGFLYYVMPHVEGESLRQKMDREKQLSVDETIELAKAVAGALQYAHEQGIVHRDIKPENILLQRGQPLVADFGIALAVSQAGGARLTETGLSLGTPHYMSPEQATGDRELDARSDVYSLGAMVYEMLTGEPPHHGSTVQAIIARILSADPEPITRHRPSVPVHVDAAVRKALDKTPADRFSSAAKFAEALTDPTFTSVTVSAASAGRPARPPARQPAAVLGVATILALALAAWGWLRPSPRAASPVIRYRLLDRALDQAQDYGSNLALSPDGDVLVRAGYGDSGGTFGLWVQRRNQLDATLLPGGENAHQPFFSPDGTHVGFITMDRALRVASLGGEPTVTLVDSGVVRGGGSWGTDGYIYVTGGNVGVETASPTGIARIPASGGQLEVVTTLDTARAEVSHNFPEALPGGHGVLFVVSRDRQYVAEDEEIAVADLATGTHRVLLRGVQVRWSPTGYLLVVQADGRLVAAPFDPNRLELTGPAVPLLGGVRVDGLGTADITISANGRLVYGAGGAETTASLEAVWVSHDGSASFIDSSWAGLLFNPSLSPDGSMMAVQVGVAPTADVWVKHLDRGPFSRLTFNGRFNGVPAWTADGRSVVFLSDREEGGVRAYRKRADGSGAPTRLSNVEMREALYSRDGQWLVYVTAPNATKPGIYAVQVGQDTTPVLLVPRRYDENGIRLSPDGRWLAYTSMESGPREVFVCPFPDGAASARWQVSAEGGSQPRWSPDGRELYYLAPNPDHVVAVRVVPGSAFSTGEHRTLFSLPTGATTFGWDVTPDGRRFTMIRARAGPAGRNARELVVVENFFEELRAKTGK
jgi:tRNA A-37 threonylcarbamoyl transferase component Bud32